MYFSSQTPDSTETYFRLVFSWEVKMSPYKYTYWEVYVFDWQLLPDCLKAFKITEA